MLVHIYIGSIHQFAYATPS